MMSSQHDNLPSPQHADHLVDVLHYWASQRPNQEMLRFYPQGEVTEAYESRSFSAFYNNALAIAKAISLAGNDANNATRAVLFYQSGINFLEALFGCFIAGVIAVPAYPPRRNQNLARITALVEDCQPSFILSSQQVQEQSQSIIKEQCGINTPWINTDQVNKTHLTLPSQAPQLDASSIAFLQYTSGSTGKPKGVMVSHDNLISNIRMAESSFCLPSDTRCISWLPLFHDMGLIGAVMMPMYWGAGSWLMPPAAFLQKPLRWLELISEAGKTSHVASASPNFGYQLCIDHIKPSEQPQLDLRQWVFALNGAEPIRTETVNTFNQQFAELGFKESAMGPSYGMAECTLLASTRRQKPLQAIQVNALKLSVDKLEVVDTMDPLHEVQSLLDLHSSGSGCTGQTLLIVKDDIVQEDGKVGEIWLKGEHIAQGYWQQAELTELTFQAYTQCGQGPFLRTGDRGALINNELYITGRSKDMLVIRGRNIYPQDIEYTASRSHDAFHHDSAAAFSISENNQEALVIVQEISRHGRKNFDADSASLAIRKAIAKEHGVEIKHIAFIKFASIAKTSSGKIQRHRCKALFIEGGLKLQASWSTSEIDNDKFKAIDVSLPVLDAFIAQSGSAEGTANNIAELTHYLRQSIANKLKTDIHHIPTDEALDGTGLDSIDIIHIASDIETWAHCRLDHSVFFDSENLVDLSTQLHQKIVLDNNNPYSATSHDQSDVEGFL